jgi:addiction module HigA family antidote
LLYGILVIRGFKHRGLKRLYERGDRAGIRPDLLETVEDILGRLDRAATPQALNLPGYRLHPLKGEMRGYWSVTVRANWRIIFHFDGEDALDVELIDYHERRGETPMPMKNPPHPGRSIRTACLEPLGLSISEGAKILGVTRQALNNVIAGKSGISPEMAIRLTKAFGSTPETWLGMQLAYDLAAARKNESKIKVRRQRVEELHAY